MWSQSRSKASLRSIMVAPEGGRTPPTMTSPTSPSAWQPTTVMVRFAAMWRSSSRRRRTLPPMVFRRDI
jgi:hypothetical protein